MVHTASLSVLRRGLWAAAALCAGALGVQLLYQATHKPQAVSVLSPSAAALRLEESVSIGAFYRGVGVPLHGAPTPEPVLRRLSGHPLSWGRYETARVLLVWAVSPTAAATVATLWASLPPVPGTPVEWVVAVPTPRWLPKGLRSDGVTASRSALARAERLFHVTAHERALVVYVVGPHLKEHYLDVVAPFRSRAAKKNTVDVLRTELGHIP